MQTRNTIIETVAANRGCTLYRLAKTMNADAGTVRRQVACLAMAGRLVVRYDDEHKMHIDLAGDE